MFHNYEVGNVVKKKSDSTLKRTYMAFLLFLIMPILSIAQSRYDVPASAPIMNTYIPMSPQEIYMMAAAKAMREKQLKENFENYSRNAYNCLHKRQIDCFLSYAQAALDCGYYNSHLYYNIGISYIIIGSKRKGKKYLKKARKLGMPKANQALDAIKKKEEISYNWFIY